MYNNVYKKIFFFFLSLRIKNIGEHGFPSNQFEKIQTYLYSMRSYMLFG
jgi:hypothetical protein